MDGSLLAQVRERLAATELDEITQRLVLAACLGDDPLASAVAGDAITVGDEAGSDADPGSVYLAGIEVEGFRGIGPRAGIMFNPGPGLTLVVGRNGSGKSSFAEGLEMLLTGSNLRWQDRASAWKDGWRNLHKPDEVGLQAEFYLQGEHQPALINRRWDAGAAADESIDAVQLPKGEESDIDGLGWAGALDNFRPFLSYNELGSMLEDRPSDLHDAMSAFLGLDGLLAAQDRLRRLRLDYEKPAKDLKKQTEQVVEHLGATDDLRAAEAAELLGKRTPALDELAALAQVGGDDAESGHLKAVAALSPPEAAQCSAAADALASAIDAVAAAAGSQAGQARELAALLRGALDHDPDGSATCPVCKTEGVLTDQWRTDTAAEIAALEAEAASAADAIDHLDACRRAGRTAIVSVPAALRDVEGLETSAAAVTAWDAWADTPQSDTDLVERLRQVDAVVSAVDAVKAEAAQQLDERDAGWQPHVRAIANWLDDAKAAAESTVHAKQLKVAENWLKDAIGEIRTQRFEPVADQSRHLWSLLRHQSNVELQEVSLEGANTNRRVSLEVTVDGEAAAALGVMSQGELHALALSLFLPRATMPESPFQFIVIDDPVQAMDPARVDGLARVLEEVAKTHQVIVFTHDERLPESVRRLGIPAEQIGVTRQPGSRVSTRVVWDAVYTALDDARSVARTNEMAIKARQKVVPTYCRLAVESAAAATVRRRRLARGDAHADVEAKLAQMHSLRKLVALALFDDDQRSKEVNDYLKANCDGKPDWALHWCNAGAHGEFDDDPKQLVEESKRLATYLAARS